MRLLGLAAALWGMASSTLPALDPNRQVTQYSQSVWNNLNGLPQNSVHAIAQTPDGYLWLGTEAGLVRFDGYRFQVFDEHSHKELKGSFIRGLLAARDGSLWIETPDGLVRYENGRFQGYGGGAQIHRAANVSLVETADGSIWYTNESEDLYRVKDGKLETLPQHGVRGLSVDKNGLLWVATSNGAWTWEGGRIAARPLPGLPSQQLNALQWARDGSLWVTTADAGVLRWDGKTWRAWLRNIAPDQPRQILEDRDGNIWVALRFGGAARISPGGALALHSTQTGLPHNSVSALFEDREGTLWMGLVTGGIAQLRDSRLLNFGAREGLKNETVWTVAESPDGSIWAGTDGGGLFRLQDGRLRQFTVQDGLPGDHIFGLKAARDGAIWCGTERGAGRFAGGQFQGFGGASLASNIVQDAAGNVWLGYMGDGLVRVDSGGNQASFRKSAGFVSDHITCLHAAGDGSVWVAVAGGGVTQYRNGAFHRPPVAGQIASTVKTMAESPDGTLWLGTVSSGLYALRDGRLSQFTAKDGLPDNRIKGLVLDRLGGLWLSGDHGIFQTSLRNLKDFESRSVDRISGRRFGLEDGMRNPEASDGSNSTALQGRDGKLWFPTAAGLVMIDPASLKPAAQRPLVHIEEVRFDGSAVTSGQMRGLPPGRGNLEFHFTGISMASRETMRFRYRLEEYDPAWVESGTRRTAFYTNMPAGTYRFRVQAATAEGPWTESPTAAVLTLRPHFSETPWFYLLWASVLGGVGFFVVRLRMLRLRNRTVDLEAAVAHRTAELEAAMKAAEAAAQTKTQFLANMSHEIRTPINGVLGMTDLALGTALTQEQRGYLGAVKSSAESLLVLVNELLDLSKIEAGRLELESVPFSLREVVQGAVQTLSAQAWQKGLGLGARLEDLSGEWVNGDPNRLRQVLLNLIGNAVKFTEVGEVRVVVEEIGCEGGRMDLLFSISDTGIGIPADKQELIFEAFRQAEGSTARRYGGTGLGLAIASRLVEKMGGKLIVKSQEGIGSTFSFRLQMPVAAPAIQPSSQTPQLLPPAQQRSILVVEDNLVNQQLIVRLLEKAGHKVEVASNGKDALVLLGLLDIDLVLMDVHMPEMDGFETTREIRRRGNRLPIVALTASAMAGDRERCFEAGMDGYLAKPVRALDLYQTIEEYTARRGGVTG